MSVEAFFDDTCGFSNRARHWRDPLESVGGQQLVWRPFSLLQQNRGGDGGPVFDRAEYADTVSLVALAVPRRKPIRVKLIAERRTGQLLGAQIVGEEGAAERIDVLATALWHGTTVDDLINTDLSYAPPFSPLWDPVLIAARKTSQQVNTDRSRKPSTPPVQDDQP